MPVLLGGEGSFDPAGVPSRLQSTGSRGVQCEWGMLGVLADYELVIYCKASEDKLNAKWSVLSIRLLEAM